MYTSHFCGKIAEDFIYSVRIEPCAHIIVSNFVVILQNAIFIKKLTGKKQLVFRFISFGLNNFLLWVFGTHLILKLKKITTVLVNRDYPVKITFSLWNASNS